MGGESRPVALGEVTELVTGFPFKSTKFTEANDDVRLLRGDNISQGTIRWDGVKRWPKSEIGEYSSLLLSAGDVVLAMDRPWIEAGLKHATLTEFDCRHSWFNG
jgi:type I restriction enzyme, S subunit